MLVVAIIGLLAAIAIPKFANLVIKAKEAALRGKLGSYRSAISIYYADNEGLYPSSMNTLTVGGRYLDALPRGEVPTLPGVHTEGDGVSGNVAMLDWNSTAPRGGSSPYTWFFPLLNNTQLVVNCTHTDSKGTTWSLY